jgi:hypothetical protein
LSKAVNVFPIMENNIFMKTSEWVNEWVSDCCLTLSNFSAISWREQVNLQWDDDEVCVVLDQNAELGFL